MPNHVRPNLFSLPSAMSERSATELVHIGSGIFAATVGPMSDLTSDLQRSSVYFDPVAQGRRLRRALAEVPVSRDASRLPDEWVVLLPSGASLLTPEGVAGVHALRTALDEQTDGIVMLNEHLVDALAALHVQYRKWSRHRLDSVIGLLEGTDKPLQAQAAGVLIALLFNGNTSRDHALPRFGESNPQQRKIIDDAFFTAAKAFVKEVSPTSLTRSGSGRLISGWPMHEIARRVGAELVVEKPTEIEPGYVYLDSAAIPRAVDLIARDLQRGNRDIPSLDAFESGVDGVANSLQSVSAQLAGARAFHETPPNTRRTRDHLLQAYARQFRENEGGSS